MPILEELIVNQPVARSNSQIYSKVKTDVYREGVFVYFPVACAQLRSRTQRGMNTGVDIRLEAWTP